MKIYYAHPMSLYGMKQKQRDVSISEGWGFTVIDPKKDDYKKRGARIFRWI